MRKKVFVKWWPSSTFQKKLKDRHHVWVAHSRTKSEIKISPLRGTEAILISNTQVIQATLGS